MKQVIAFIKPHQLSPVAIGLRDIPELTGLSIGKGQGFGRGRARSAAHRIVEDEMAYIPHVRIEVFCSDERARRGRDLHRRATPTPASPATARSTSRT